MKKETSNSFPTIAGVLEHLKASGWKVTKSSLYRHAREGKLLPGDDGAFRFKDVEKYARTWLRKQSTGKKVSEKTDELQTKKLDQDLRIGAIEEKRKQLALDRELGHYVPREEVEIGYATWAGIMVAGVKHLIKAHAADWIRLVDGNTQKAGELISQETREFEELISGHTVMEFNVIFEKRKDAEVSEEMEASEVMEALEEAEGKGVPC